jgi:hypothetical protein
MAPNAPDSKGKLVSLEKLGEGSAMAGALIGGHVKEAPARYEKPEPVPICFEVVKNDPELPLHSLDNRGPRPLTA